MKKSDPKESDSPSQLIDADRGTRRLVWRDALANPQAGSRGLYDLGMKRSSLFWYAIEWPVALFWHAYAQLSRLTSKVTISGDMPSIPAIFVNRHRHQTFLEQGDGGNRIG